MDFVMIEIFYLLCFSLSLQGAFGVITDPPPLNQAVLDGTRNVEIKCFCTGDPETIKWSFMPVRDPTEKTIKNGDRITDDDFEGFLDADSKSYTLTIKTASSSTAGTYTCDEDGIYSVQLIVLDGLASCDFTPRDTKQLSCDDSTFQVSCTLSYFANTGFADFVLKWSTELDPDYDDRFPGQDGNTTTSEITWITTATSIYNVRWPFEGDIPIYKCEAIFTVTESAPGTFQAPVDIPSCQPFTSPGDVPCTDKDGNLRPYTILSHDDPGIAAAVPPTNSTVIPVANDDPGTAALPPTTSTSTVPVPGSNDNPKDDPKKSGDFSASPRSAETNNLAILVLGVAGVLLLAWP